MKKLGRVLGMLVAIAVLAVTLGALVPRPLWRAANANPVATRHILVLKNPIHTDIAIPVDDAVRERFHFLRCRRHAGRHRGGPLHRLRLGRARLLP